MEQQTEVATGANGESVLRYKFGEEGQAIKLAALTKNLGELEALYNRQQDAAEDYAATVKVVAEKTGLMPSVIRKYVKALGDEKKRDKAKEEAGQLALLFEEL